MVGLNQVPGDGFMLCSIDKHYLKTLFHHIEIWHNFYSIKIVNKVLHFDKIFSCDQFVEEISPSNQTIIRGNAMYCFVYINACRIAYFHAYMYIYCMLVFFSDHDILLLYRKIYGELIYACMHVNILCYLCICLYVV